MKIIFILALFSLSTFAADCSQTCPSDYRILQGNRTQFNFMNFKNFSYRSIGKCRGHAIVGQKLSELAYFEQSSECMKTSSNKCAQDIRAGIRSIINFKTYTFFGFPNLKEFSSNDTVKNILKSYVRATSHRYRANQASIRDLGYENAHESIFHELILRVKENQQPYIGIKGDSVGQHAIVAYDIAFREGHEVLCIRDSNILFEHGESCQNYLYFKNSKVRYKRFKRKVANLFTFQLMSDEDRRVKKYISAQVERCLKKIKCIE